MAAEAENVFPSSGRVAIGTAQPKEELHVNGNVLISTRWSDWLFLRQERDKEGGGGFHIHNPWGNSNQGAGHPSRNALSIGYRTFDGRNLWSQFVLHGPTGRIGIGTGKPAAKLDVAGTTRTEVLQITGGSDLAESFPIGGDNEIAPGMVVSIDPEHPGWLRVAREPYDRTVAGVVSGSQGLGPGLTMGHQDQLAEGALPVALSGRVYALADAANGPIEPGDLLTTAETPGSRHEGDRPRTRPRRDHRQGDDFPDERARRSARAGYAAIAASSRCTAAGDTTRLAGASGHK